MAETATEAPPMPPPPPLYTNTAGEAKLKQHYDATLASLPFPHEERWVDTSFGRAHVVVCGAPDAPPLVLWHGTAAPAPFMLLAVQPLLQHYRVFCPDIPCQGGSRTDPAVLDPATHAHGRWCWEVVKGLGLLDAGGEGAASVRPPLHVGISLGGAMLLDLAVMKPEAIGGAALLGPGSLHPDYGKSGMPWRLALGFAAHYFLPCTPTAWLALVPMCDEPLEKDPSLENVLLAIRFCCYFPEGPRTFTDEQLRRLTAPTLLVAAEHDIFGPGEATVNRARAVWPNAEAVLIRGGKHVPSAQSMQEVNQRIISFFEEKGLAGAA